MTQAIQVLDDEELVVRTPDEFHRAPKDYQKILISQLMINTEGELSDGSSADDSGLGALAGSSAVGSSADNNVIRDCIALGLSVTPS